MTVPTQSKPSMTGNIILTEDGVMMTGCMDGEKVGYTDLMEASALFREELNLMNGLTNLSIVLFLAAELVTFLVQQTQ